MTKAKTPMKHPKIVNEWMIYEGINDINSVFGALMTLKTFLNSPEFSKQGATWAIESIQSTLCNGTQMMNNGAKLRKR